MYHVPSQGRAWREVDSPPPLQIFQSPKIHGIFFVSHFLGQLIIKLGNLLKEQKVFTFQCFILNKKCPVFWIEQTMWFMKAGA